MSDTHGVMLRSGQSLIVSVIALLCVGMVLVASAGLRVDGSTLTDVDTLVSMRSTLFAALAVGCLFVGRFIPWERLPLGNGWHRGDLWIIGIAVFAAALAYVPGLGREVNGAQRWVNLGWFSFQPSEVAKWCVPIAVALYSIRVGVEKMARFKEGFLIPIAAVGVVSLLIAAEDLGTGVLIGIVGALTLLAAGTSFRHMLTVVPVAVVGIVGLVITSPYRVNRILAYLDPYADPQGIGYHIIQSLGAISGGGLAGRGIGEGIQKYGYLPEATTDFIFSVATEELGIAGAMLIVFLVGWMIWSGVSVIESAAPSPGVPDGPQSRLLRLAATGIIAMVAIQAVINLFVVTGLAPTKGIALPLISRGGTGWMMTALSLGLIVRLDAIGSRLLSGPTVGELREDEDDSAVAAIHAEEDFESGMRAS
ncbi:MAG: FtsW/RodA/SpoVE family cell cycle protein [Planctomycetota bacterium]|nr:FtsW/RodA/SpoVE family cell cycle protein [Planctomycetota bacterium]